MGNYRGGSRRSTNNKPAQGATLMKLRHRNGITPADKGPQRPEPKSSTSSDTERTMIRRGTRMHHHRERLVSVDLVETV